MGKINLRPVFGRLFKPNFKFINALLWSDPDTENEGSPEGEQANPWYKGAVKEP